MSSLQDPLQLLTHALTTKKDVYLVGADGSTRVYDMVEAQFISLPSLSSASERVVLPKSVPTRYKIDDNAHYDLQTLLFGAITKDDSVGEYLQKANKAGVQFITIVVRQAVLDLLYGRREPGPEIDLLPEETATVQSSGGNDEERPTKKAKYQVNKEDQESVKRISNHQEPRPLLDRDSILRGSKPASFDYVRQLVSDRLKAFKEDIDKMDKGGMSLNNMMPGQTPDRKKRAQHPIIIVSPSSSALITMSNVKRFLEDGVFEQVAAGNKNMEDVVTVYHRRQIGTLTAAQAAAATSGASGLGSSSLGAGERQARYFVVDSVEALSKFGDDAWDRVVCVMTTGQEWQFRPYKWAEPKELFHHVKGVYFSQTTDMANQKISSWNVTELKLDPSKRYIDKSVVAEFWRILESWIAM